MTRIIYNGKKPYQMIIRNVEHLIYHGEEIDVNTKKIRKTKMRRFTLSSVKEKELKEKQRLKELEKRVTIVEKNKVVTPI